MNFSKSIFHPIILFSVTMFFFLEATSQEADDLKASEQFYRPYGYNLGFGFGGYPPIRAYPGRFYGRYYGGYPFYYG